MSDQPTIQPATTGSRNGGPPDPAPERATSILDDAAEAMELRDRLVVLEETTDAQRRALLLLAAGLVLLAVATIAQSYLIRSARAVAQ